MKYTYILLFTFLFTRSIQAQKNVDHFRFHQPKANPPELITNTNDKSTLPQLRTNDEDSRLWAESNYNSYDASTYTPYDSSFITYSAANNMETKTYFFWDLIDMVWNERSKSTYAYDEENHMTERIFQEFDGGVYTNSNRQLYSYDASGNQISYTYEFWFITDEWGGLFRELYTYDDDNMLLSSTYQDWEDSVYEDDSRTLYTYTPEGKIETITGQYYSGGWSNSYIYTYFYDVSGNLTQTLFQNWDGAAWLNYLQFLYSYDVENRITNSSMQYWGDGVWDDNSRETYNYDTVSGLLSDVLSEFIFDGDWMIDDLSIYEYDAEENITSILKQTDAGGGTWENEYKFIYSYDADGNNILFEEKIWDGVSDFSPSLYYRYYYETYLDIFQPSAQILLNAYPNPCNDLLIIELPENTYENKLLVIKNLDGQIVLSRQLDISGFTTEINVSSLPAGNYLYTVLTDKGFFTGKVAKL